MTALVGWQLTVVPGPHDDPEEIDAALNDDGDWLLVSVSYGKGRIPRWSLRRC